MPKTPSRPQTTTPIARDPRYIDLTTAAGEIRQAYDELGAQASRSPFFLVVGAGISFPPVPLAGAIIEHCQGVAQKYHRAQTPAADATLDLYSHWFGKAYPGARQRQTYLRQLIEKKPLSLASLRLAHLLSAHKLTNLVVTTNFDDFLARALRLFGEEPAVCDHARTVGRIGDADTVQIVHVHGSYVFYDLANLRGEVIGRAKPDEEISLTMLGLLDNVLWSRSPLVIGYSGWEGDIVMSALRRRLRSGHPLAQMIYWFAYKRSEIERLPDWLRDSADVRFVVPDEAPPDGAAASGAPSRGTTATSGLEQKTEPSLPAFAVFDRLNQVFEIGAPALFENPIRYFAKSLESALPESGAAAADPYAFKSLVERLYRVADSWITTPPATPTEAPLEQVRQAVRESKYPEAAALLAALIPSQLAKLDETARRELLDAAALTGAALFASLEEGTLRIDATLKAVPPYDIRVDRTLGQLPPGTAWCIASRPGQYGMEATKDGKVYGALTWHLVPALREASADVDGDGRISVLEAVIKSSAAIPDQERYQTPVVAGDADRIALFAAKPLSKAETGAGTVHALLLGVADVPNVPGALGGPTNDVALMAELIGTKEQRLFAKAEVTRLANKQATLSKVRAALSLLAAETEPADLLLVYFSGRGFRTETGKQDETPAEYVLVMHDWDDKGNGQLRHSELMALLAPAKAAQKLVILDF